MGTKAGIGPEVIQNELNRLQYGNGDISDWEERANTNNTNRNPESFQQLKQVMLAVDYETEYPVYGKTGTGRAAGVVIDSWLTGFVGIEEENIYFYIYLGRTDGENVSCTKAKEIALNIISDCF